MKACRHQVWRVRAHNGNVLLRELLVSPDDVVVHDTYTNYIPVHVNKCRGMKGRLWEPFSLLSSFSGGKFELQFGEPGQLVGAEMVEEKDIYLTLVMDLTALCRRQNVTVNFDRIAICDSCTAHLHTCPMCNGTGVRGAENVLSSYSPDER